MKFSERLGESRAVSVLREMAAVGMVSRALLGALAGYSIALMGGGSIQALGVGSESARLLGVVGFGVAAVALYRLGSCGSSGDCGCSADGDCS